MIMLFGSKYCAPCHVIKHKLDAYDITYNYIDVESEDGNALVDKYGVSSVPTMVMVDGAVVSHITGSAINEELARILK